MQPLLFLHIGVLQSGFLILLGLSFPVPLRARGLSGSLSRVVLGKNEPSTKSQQE